MIIDSHTHICNTIFEMPSNNLLKAMKKYNIDYSIFSNISCAELDCNQNIVTDNNKLNQLQGLVEAIKFAKLHKNCFVSAWICPLSEKCDNNFQNMILENLDVVCSLKFHPFHSGLNIEDEKLIPYLQFANQNGIPIAVHTANGDSSSFHVGNIADKYPNINFILVHMGLGTDHAESIEVISKHDNVYGDTTWVSVNEYLNAVKKLGYDKIAFGSDMPIDGIDTYSKLKNGDKSIYIDYFELKGKLSSINYSKLMHLNAERIYKLKIKKHST